MAKYKNVTLLLVGIIVTVFLLTLEILQAFILNLGDFGYLGGFVAGIFFVSTFTVVPAGVTLFLIGGNLNPFVLSIIAGCGAVAGDLLIFRFVKDELNKEIVSLTSGVFKKNYLKRIVRLKFFSYLLPVIGALIIASPFPDELGITMMGVAKIKTWKLIILTFILNSFGIFLVIESARII